MDNFQGVFNLLTHPFWGGIFTTFRVCFPLKIRWFLFFFNGHKGWKFYPKQMTFYSIPSPQWLNYWMIFHIHGSHCAYYLGMFAHLFFLAICLDGGGGHEILAHITIQCSWDYFCSYWTTLYVVLSIAQPNMLRCHNFFSGQPDPLPPTWCVGFGCWHPLGPSCKGSNTSKWSCHSWLNSRQIPSY